MRIFIVISIIISSSSSSCSNSSKQSSYKPIKEVVDPIIQLPQITHLETIAMSNFTIIRKKNAGVYNET